MTLNEFNTALESGLYDIKSIIDVFLNSDWTTDDLDSQVKNRLDECRQRVCDKADGLSAEQLNRLIEKKFFTYDQLMKNAKARLDPNKLKKLAALNGPVPTSQTSQGQKGDTKGGLQWRTIDKTDRFALDDFIKSYPNSDKVDFAKRTLETLGTDASALVHDYIEKGNAYGGITEFMSRGWIGKKELVSILRKDNNILPVFTVKRLMDDSALSLHDLEEAGFSEGIIRAILGRPPRYYQIPTLSPIEQRVRESHDFYFWGTSGSGKSCALGAILSAANNNNQFTYKTDRTCQGDAYIEVLQNIFRNDGSLGVLPPGTPVGAFAELGFDISDGEKNYHITCIDMAGGVLDILSKPQLTENEKKIKNDLVTLMDNAPTKNRCHHVFLLEYRIGNTQEQADKLDRAISHLRKTNYFKKTDGITVLVTKVDRMDNYSHQTVDKEVDNYITKNFQGFRNQLEFICTDNHINNGKIEVLPFNIGKVEMQTYCIFNDFYALQFIKRVFLKG